MNDPIRDSLNHRSHPDDVFHTRIEAALRQLDLPESDDDIAAALDAVECQPMAESAIQRILHQTRFRIAASQDLAPRESSVPESFSGGTGLRKRSEASHISIVVACLGLVIAVGALTQMGSSLRIASNRDNETVLTGRGTMASYGLIGNRDVPSPRTPADALPADQPETVSQGQMLATGPREKRRVTLPDGSVLSMNELSRVNVVGRRRIKLLQGEVFVEVVPQPASGSRPKSAERFVVETARREVTALGTKFVVKAQGEATNVVVTQGKVAVSGFDQVIPAGQELIADQTESHLQNCVPRSVPRTSWNGSRT
ncbi:MAG: FecR domain-containing protein [Planctomycetaceae bacterium]